MIAFVNGGLVFYWFDCFKQWFWVVVNVNDGWVVIEWRLTGGLYGYESIVDGF